MNERAKKTSPPKRQRGGFVVGLIVGLLVATAQVIRNALAVLGVSAPERMDRDAPESQETP